jgi:hypothetical protein
MRHRLSGAAFGLLGVLVLAACGGSAAQPPTRAKNVILFLADAGGLSTIHAASLHAHGEPNRLFLQQMPYIALGHHDGPRSRHRFGCGHDGHRHGPAHGQRRRVDSGRARR